MKRQSELQGNELAEVGRNDHPPTYVGYKVTASYELKLLKVATPNFLYMWFAQQGGVRDPLVLPENTGDTVQFTKPTAFAAVTTALTENVVPAGEDLTLTSSTGVVSAYGAYVKYTKKLLQLGIHKINAIASDLLGRQAGLSLDTLVRATVVANGTVQFVNNRANRAALIAGDYISATELMEAWATLQAANATPPLENKFPVIIHPNTMYDLLNDPIVQAVFINGSKGVDSDNPMITGYLGEILGLCFYMSSNAYHVASTVEVHASVILGKDSYGIGGLAAYMPQAMNQSRDGNNTDVADIRPLRLISHDFGSFGDDPFDQTATLAWYTTLFVIALDNNFYIRLEHDDSLD